MGIVKSILGSVQLRPSKHDRRNIELALLALAAVPSFLLFWLAAANTGAAITADTFTYPIIITAVFLAIHIATRVLAKGGDPATLPIAYVLVSIGVAFLVRLAPDIVALAVDNDPAFTPEDVQKQIRNLIIAAVLLIALLAVTLKKFKMERLAQYSTIFLGAAIVLLVLPLLPVIGHEVNGAHSWIKLGPVTLQPGEMAKLLMILGLASYMSGHRELLSIFTVRKGPIHLPDFQTLRPMLVMWGVAMAIIAFEKDFGTAFVLFAIFLVMLYVSTGRLFYVVIGVALVAAGVALLLALPFFGHLHVRIDNWLNPFADPQNTGYQMSQSLFSLADGDIFGTGIGLGLCYNVPIVWSDYIFTAIAEETGLFGADCVLMFYFCFAIRGYLVAARAKSDFACMVAVGMTSMIVVQAFIIVAGITRIIPLTGITLPFMSDGGSSLIACFIALGFIIRCGDEGTGVKTRIVTFFDNMDRKGVLGRYALGKRLTYALIALAFLYAWLIFSLICIMFVDAKTYQEMPENNHTAIHQLDVKRGSISTADGVVLAQSVKDEEDPNSGYHREYPAGNLASQVVGYSSRQYGESGIEAACNGFLAGRAGNSFTSTFSGILGNTTDGNDVTLTLDSRIQRAAQDALDGYTGACVVMDADSGAVLAMASAPTYDAGSFAEILEAAAAGSDDSSMLNRAIQSRYAPGSTFKTVTLATALENGVANADTVYPSPSEMEIGGKPVVNYNHEDLGELTLADAYAYSSNTVFAQLGQQIGAERLVEGAKAFGFDEELDFELDVATSRMAEAGRMSDWELAWASVGQPVGQTADNGPYATVLEMALTGAAIANGGEIMNPYIVEGVYSPEGVKTSGASQRVLKRACSSGTAKKVEEMMKGVVDYGTGTGAAIDGYTVYGKTGTAETSREADDSWFVGYVDCDGHKFVVAMVLEEAYEHGDGLNAASHCSNVFSAIAETRNG